MKRLSWVFLVLIPFAHSHQFSTTIQGESIQYLNSKNDNSEFNQLSLSGEYKNNLTSYSRVLIKPRIRKSTQSGTKNSNQILEGYIDVRFDESDLRIGQQILSWGRTDIINPINIGRQDYSDPLSSDDSKLGQMALNYRHYYSSFDMEFIWMPYYQDSSLPNIDNPWFIDLPKQSDDGRNINYQLTSVDQPSTSLENSQIAIRFTTKLAGWDLGFNYFNGWNDIPIYDTTITQATQSNIEIEITPHPYEQQMIGIDFATNSDSISSRMEYAYIHTKDTSGVEDLIDDPYHHAVFGIDTDLDLFNPQYISRILLEYSRQFKTTNINYAPQDLDHIFENTVFIRFSTEKAPIWSFELDGAYDIKNNDQLIRPRLEYSIIDDLKLAVSYEWLDGSAESFFGTYEKNQSLRITLTHDSLVF